MRGRSRIVLILAFCLSLTPSFLAAKPFNQVLEAYIASEAKDGSEFKEGRRVVNSDMDNDGDPDAVVLYSVEGFGGGNSWGQRLVVFINEKGSYRPGREETVGGKFFRSFDLVSVKGGRILGRTESCGD